MKITYAQGIPLSAELVDTHYATMKHCELENKSPRQPAKYDKLVSRRLIALYYNIAATFIT